MKFIEMTNTCVECFKLRGIKLLSHCSGSEKVESTNVLVDISLHLAVASFREGFL